ncbi:PAS domain-containing sensor histidine kinase [Rhodoferax sp. GW822-FHT02A01]|uniref:sensor histidine kinase n=1 Tax=Rhodoferax sp. GW822-FHT02A01 TaxID=3141537 RepID=UPI00315C886B
MSPSTHQDHFRLVVDAAPTGIVMVDPNGQIVLVNRHLLSLFGYSESDLMGQPVEILLPQRIRATHPGKVRAFFSAPSNRAMGAGRDLYAVRIDGREIPVEIGLTPVDTEGGLHVLATIVDITERKNAEKQRARSRDQFNAVVEAAPAGIVMVDENARITLVNCQIESLFGYSREDLIGQPIEILLPTRMRMAHPEKVRSFFTNPTTRAMGAGRDLYAARFDGTEFPVEIGLSPIDLMDGRQVLATIVDITERKKSELRVLRANEGLEQFVYVASHDLRSPLRGIADLLEWIKEDIESTPNEKALANIARATLRVERLERLIDDLLRYARAGAVDAEIMPINLQTLVTQVLELQPLRAGFEVKLDIAPIIVHAARTPIETVLRNLISNAVKHHDRDEGVITIGVRDKGKYFEFSIGDDGPGIPEHAQTRIFKLFQTATSTDRQSSGVGLAVSKRLVEAHGGWIAVESAAAQRGTTFRFIWPNNQPNKGGGQS